jgi:hypothetical protein
VTAIDQSRSADRYPASNPSEGQPNKRARTTASPLQEPSASPSTTSVPALTPAGRISHACRPCNRSKVKCDGFHPCSRCFAMVKAGVTGSTEDGRSPPGTVPEDQGTGEGDKVRRAALELCFYQPSMRGRTKRRKTKPDARLSREEADDPSSSVGPRQLSTSRTSTNDEPVVQRPFPRVNTSPRPPTPGTAAAPIPSLQAAFFQSSTKRQREESEGAGPSWRAYAPPSEREREQYRPRPSQPERLTEATPHQTAPYTDPRLHRHLEGRSHNGETEERIQLAPMVDRAKLTSFPLPGDETNPLGVLAEASAALEWERDRDGRGGDGEIRKASSSTDRRDGQGNARGTNDVTTRNTDDPEPRKQSTSSRPNDPPTQHTTAPPDADAYYSRPKQGTAAPSRAKRRTSWPSSRKPMRSTCSPSTGGGSIRICRCWTRTIPIRLMSPVGATISSMLVSLASTARKMSAESGIV